MEHIKRSFRVALKVRHPDIDPAEISTALNLAPRRMTRAGAPRTSTKGDVLTGVYQFSHWSHAFDVENASELGAVLHGLVEQLQTHQQFFHRVVREGGSVELFCGIWAAGNWDEILSYSLMGQLAALHLDLRLDVYPKAD